MIRLCAICGRPYEAEHHLIFGNSLRALADEDSLIIDMCNNCHNMSFDAKGRIHGNSMAEALSKMLGQERFEKRAILNGATEQEAREMFMKRYGRNYLEALWD